MGSSLSIVSLTSHLLGNLISDFLNGCSSGHLPRKRLWMRDRRIVFYTSCEGKGYILFPRALAV